QSSSVHHTNTFYTNYKQKEIDLESEDSLSPLVVEKSEVVLVKPSKPTPDVSLSLSTLDNDPMVESIVQTICVFAPEPYLEDQANHDLAYLLQHALSHALVYYYPFAGKLHRKSDDNRLQLNCKPGDGVPFIRATAACTLSSLNYLDSAGDEAYQLVPCYEPVKGCEGYDPLALQVTKFACGGITIGMAHSHSVADGDIGGVVDFPEAGSFIATSANTLTGDMAREILNITYIMKLKKTIANDEQITNENEEKVVVTTLEIIAAQVWRARCRVLNMSPDEAVVLGMAIGIRSFIEPPLLEGYYGNALISGSVGMTANELTKSSLSRVVRLIKDMKRAALDKRYVFGKLCEIERRLKEMSSTIGISKGVLTVTDWRQISLQYNGWGGLVNIIPLVPMTVDLCVLLPASKADPGMSGGVRVLVTLPRDVMAEFKEEIKLSTK
ncbi:LOW QUALITY PROTEIN: hypothetical protein HID58_062468, partial [Brassica napus]